jgi:hypothetical protein
MRATWYMIVAMVTVVDVGLARAEGIPRFDADQLCQKVAGFGGTYSQASFEGCLDMEQSAYNRLKQSWDGISGGTLQHCVQVAHFTDPGSYSLLHGCIDMETRVDTPNRQRRSRY